MAMTDEELTELECVVDLYWLEYRDTDCRCPMYAVSRARCGTPRSMRGAALALGLRSDLGLRFAEGFDDLRIGYIDANYEHDEDARALYAMGLRFRERYMGSL